MHEGADEVLDGGAHRPGGEAVGLSLVGLDPGDAGALLLRGPDGATYRLPADARLRAALRTAGPVTTPSAVVAAPLRPRDIQARIRAGESAEDVAADAGVPVEAVRRYEGPVLAERAHVANLARLALVRAGGGQATLEDAVRARLVARGVDPATTAWDAWKRDGGGWAVQVAFRAAGQDRSAQWTFTPGASGLEPLDDEARWLTAPSDPDATGRRLAAVRVYDVESDGVVRELREEPVAPLPDTAAPEDIAARTQDLLEALRDRRGRRVPLLDLPPEGEGWDEDDEDDDLVNALLDLPPAAHPAGAPLEEDVAAVVEQVRARLRMVTPPEGLDLLGGPDGTGPVGAPAPLADRGAPEDGTAADEDGAPTSTAAAADAPTATPAAASSAAEPGDEDAPTSRRAARRAAQRAPQAEERPARPTIRPAGRPAAPAVAAPQAGASGEHPDADEHTQAPDHDEDRPTSRRRRPTVPSWDEIVFGAPRHD